MNSTAKIQILIILLISALTSPIHAQSASSAIHAQSDTLALQIIRHAIERHALAPSTRSAKHTSEFSSSATTLTSHTLGISNYVHTLQRPIFRKRFGALIRHPDTLTTPHIIYIPLALYEQAANEAKREVLTYGIPLPDAAKQYLAQLDIHIDLYDNYISLFNRRFASPLSRHGEIYYTYRTLHTAHREGSTLYTIAFAPRHALPTLLQGELIIDSQSFAIRAAHITIPRSSNLNWVQSMHYTANISPRDTTAHEELIATLGMNDREGSKLPRAIYRYTADLHTTTSPTPRLRNSDPHLCASLDSIYHLTRRHTTKRKLLSRGYISAGAIDLGPYYRLASYNRLEGVRVQLGATTNSKFSTTTRINGYIAYGFKDHEIKGSAEYVHMFSQLPTRRLALLYRRDATQLGAARSPFAEGSIFGTLFTRPNTSRLSVVEVASATYNHEITSNLNTSYNIEYRNIFASPYVPMVTPHGVSIRSVGTTSATVNLRLSWDEMVHRKPFTKSYLHSRYPTVELSATAATKQLHSNGYNYAKLLLKAKHELPLPPLGISSIRIISGKIFGQLPYPMLQLHEGNSTYIYSPTAFACMDYYEFASDEWVSLFYEHDFKGIILGCIPLLRRWGVRSVVCFRGVWGTLSEKNNGARSNTTAPLLFPPGMGSVNKPYFEAGVGIKNILHCLRVDACWRLSHRHAPRTTNSLATLSTTTLTPTSPSLSPSAHPSSAIRNFAITFGAEFNF